MVYFKSKRGQLAISVILFIVIGVILLAGAILSSIGTKATIISYNVGESILNSSQEDIDAITNPTIKAEVNSIVASSRANTVDAITIYSAMYRFSPFLAVVIVMLIAFLLARRSVETGQII